MRTSVVLLVGSLTLVSGNALAQTTIVETTGAAPPDEVITYIERERVPSVRVEEDVAVGYVVPGRVELRTIPKYEKYSYTIINDRRVLVDPHTRKIIRILD